MCACRRKISLRLPRLTEILQNVGLAGLEPHILKQLQALFQARLRVVALAELNPRAEELLARLEAALRMPETQG